MYTVSWWDKGMGEIVMILYKVHRLSFSPQFQKMVGSFECSVVILVSLL